MKLELYLHTGIYLCLMWWFINLHRKNKTRQCIIFISTVMFKYLFKKKNNNNYIFKSNQQLLLISGLVTPLRVCDGGKKWVKIRHTLLYFQSWNFQISTSTSMSVLKKKYKKCKAICIEMSLETQVDHSYLMTVNMSCLSVSTIHIAKQ